MRRTRRAVACLTMAWLAANASAVPSLSGTPIDASSASLRVGPLDAGLPAQGEAALLGVRINEIDQADAVLVLRRPGRALAVPVAVLAAWRVRRPSHAALSFEGEDYLELSAIPGAQWTEDSVTQTLVIQLPSVAFVRNDFEVVNAPRPQQSIARIGGFVNYDLQWQRDGASTVGPGSQQASGLIETGVFSAQGNGLSSGVWRSGTSGVAPRFTRLDTTWNIDRVASLSSLRFGDAISTAGAWGRSVRFGGIQWSTNFAVQPGLVTFALPSIRGDATVPSVVDLYINDAHQLQGKVPPGAFDLPDVPVVTGQGQIRLVVRDVLGREHVVVQPYYVSPALLRPGLHDFAVEAGNLREDYGLDSSHYGRALLSATDRVGVDVGFTRELHAEAMFDRQSIGVAGVWLVRQWAIVNAALAASHGPSGQGGLATLGIEHQAADWSAHVQARFTSPAFVTIGDSRGPAGGLGGSVASSIVSAPRSALSAGAGTNLGRGSISLDVIQQTSQADDRYRSMTLNYGHSFGAVGYLSLFATRTLGAASGTTVGLNFTTVLDATSTTGASASVGSWRDNTGNRQTTLTVQGNAPVGPGVGYQVQAERGRSDERWSAEATAQSQYATLTGGLGAANGNGVVRLGASGGVAVMPEGIYPSRRIDGSFAVVQVGDYAGIRVNRDNQLVSTTDEHGRAFVAGLRGFESNQISVEAGDLPLDAQVDDLKIDVAPGMRSGVSVRFPVRRSRSASLRLVTEDGVPLPAGLYAHLDGDPREFPIGYAGKIFVTGLGDRNLISVAWDGRHCEAAIELGSTLEDVPELGTKVCR